MENKEKHLPAKGEASPSQSERAELFWLLRYLLPLFLVLVLIVLGFFYNIPAVQGGRRIRISLWRLSYNTVVAGRSYFQGASQTAGQSDFYGFLLWGLVLFFLLYVAAIVLAVLAAFIAWRTQRGTAPKGAREDKILFKAIFRNPVVLLLSELLLLLPTLYPSYFSLICKKYLMVSGGAALYITCNVPLIVMSVLFAALVGLQIYLSKIANHTKMNLFYIEDEQDDTAN